MRIAGIQKLSMVDYPGKMACTIFLQGCNFRCPYCHNSSLVIPEPEQSYLEEEEVLAYLRKRKGILDGVCITGGEPLLFGRQLTALMEKIRNLGYLIKLDTNGTSPELLKEICEKKLVDYVAMDVKHSEEKYGIAAGICGEEDNLQAGMLLEKVKQSIHFLKNGSIDYEFRTTLVKGIHEPQDIEKMCLWLSGCQRWCLQNFKDSGAILRPNFGKMESFSENEIELFEKTAKNNRINVFVRNV